MKKLRITIEDRVYDVTVEVLEDDEGTIASPPLLPSPAPAPRAAVSAPAAPAAVARPPVQAAGPGG
ncbi:MAG: acetyl-CoA carboxylase biotin carboxyl carrier protein subunit, partial [Proteobacteria bacterium]|nr:acetyl-CoA carboxylase biotin carboxyl carrier protein subunit [Pseudomonadota bacterium]